MNYQAERMEFSRLAADQASIKQSFQEVVDLVSDDEGEETALKPRALSEEPEAAGPEDDNNEYETGTDDNEEVWETESLFEDTIQEIGDEILLEGGKLSHGHITCAELWN